jgi:hypothetical protein
MKQNKGLLLAYAAGLFDGEGCIVALHRTDIKGHHYRIALQVWMSSYEWVDLFIGLFGGSLRLSYGGTKKPGWIWDLQGLDKVHKVCKLLYPFLRVKKIQMAYQIRLIERMIVAKRWQYKGKGIGGGSGHAKLSDHEINQRDNLVIEIRKCKENAFGYPKCLTQEQAKIARATVETNHSDSVRNITLKS